MDWSLAGVAGLITALIGVGKFFEDRASKKVTAKIDNLIQIVERGQKEDKLAITRLELMNLMNYDPDNVLEIERLARRYFGPEMNGNSYMSKLYSEYAKEHKADYTFVTHL